MQIVRDVLERFCIFWVDLREIWAFTWATPYIRTNRPKFRNLLDKCIPNQPNFVQTNSNLGTTGFQGDNQGPCKSLRCNLSCVVMITSVAHSLANVKSTQCNITLMPRFPNPFMYLRLLLYLLATTSLILVLRSSDSYGWLARWKLNICGHWIVSCVTCALGSYPSAWEGQRYFHLNYPCSLTVGTTTSVFLV